MRDKEMGTFNEELTFCPVNAYGDCPYCDQNNVCHIDDPITDCDDFADIFGDWDTWINLG